MDDKRKQELTEMLDGIDERCSGRRPFVATNYNAYQDDVPRVLTPDGCEICEMAPTAIRELLDEVERLERERDEARRMALCLRDEARVNEMGSNVHWDEDNMSAGWEETLEQWRKELNND